MQDVTRFILILIFILFNFNFFTQCDQSQFQVGSNDFFGSELIILSEPVFSSILNFWQAQYDAFNKIIDRTAEHKQS